MTEREAASLLGDAWDKWCTTLRETGRRVLSGEIVEIDDPQELAEALRAAARMAMAALQQRLDFNDPDFPRFFRAMDDRFTYAGPDVYITYLSAAARGDATYRITGRHHGRELNVGRLWGPDIATDDDGTFEIIASASEHAGNWIPMDPSAIDVTSVPAMYPMAWGALSGRFYFWDPTDARPLDLRIERIDDERPERPAPLTPELLADRLDAATRLSSAMVEWWLRRAQRIRDENQPNVVGPPGTRPPGVPGFEPPTGSPLNYGVCCWELDHDDALVVETDLPDADYWSFQVYNPWWESPDNQHRQTSIAHTHAHVDDDRRFRAVLTRHDPGVPNWLDTGDGGRRGFLFYRWFRPRSAMPTPIATLCRRADVRDHLPPSHPYVSPEARRRDLELRNAWLARRFQH
jgi:hypothetical protein